MTIQPTANAKISIGSLVTFDLDQAAAALETAFEALTYVQIKSVEDMGEFGDVANELVFNAIDANRVRRMKGLRDGGTMTIVVGRDAADAGQEDLVDAAKDTTFSRAGYAFKIELDDNPDAVGDGTPTTFYFAASVMGGRTNFGQGDNIIRSTFTLAINSDIIEVAADDGA